MIAVAALLLNRKVAVPNRRDTSMAVISSRWTALFLTHHAQSCERKRKELSLTSRSPNGHGTLRQPPVEAVTRYVLSPIQ